MPNPHASVDDFGRAALPWLAGFATRAHQISRAIIQGRKCHQDDHFGFMALLFLSKQVDHLGSILTLIPRRDSMLIARSMIEGVCQLLWASSSPGDLAREWRAFSIVHDWRLMQSHLDSGVSVSDEVRQRIERRVLTDGASFLTTKGRNVLGAKQQLTDDCFHIDWRKGMGPKQTCERAGAKDIYAAYYNYFSDWDHWGSGGLGYAMSRSENRIDYASNSWGTSGAALDTAVRCLQ